MKEFNTSLLREKFVIHDLGVQPDGERKGIVALSNRIVVELSKDSGHNQETLIIRAQNMHCCARMAARLIQSYIQSGPLLNRHHPYDWEAAWDVITNDYERSYNDQRWIAVYSHGRVIFESGQRHAFLDVIEQCNAQNESDYDSAIALAEDAFKQAGKVVEIDYDGNIALVIDLERTQGRCSVILRAPNKTTTFNFSVQATEEDVISFPQCLGVAAAFLEGMQIAFMVGTIEAKIKLGLLKLAATEEKQVRDARERLKRLYTEIKTLESMFEVHYRPERPEFQHFIADAEQLALKNLAPKEEPKDD